jgi:hypothetical protein
MTIQSVIREVCSFVGVRPPQGSVFLSPYVDRTAWEFVQLANEIVQRIAYNTRDWTGLTHLATLDGDGVTDQIPLPADFKRMLLSSNVWRSSSSQSPMNFISDPDDWLRRGMANDASVWGEWRLIGTEKIHVRPILAAGISVSFAYLNKNCIALNSGGFGDQFLNDADRFRLDERLLKLAMIWQWKCNKGATYAEDLANYEDALAHAAGADKPSPIIVGHLPISSDANIAYWGPTPPGSTFVGPGI